MNKSIIVLLTIIAILLIGLGVYTFLPEKESATDIQSFEDCVAAGNPVMESYPAQCRANGQTFVEDIGNELQLTDVIKIENPRPNQTINSPLHISGEARGTWYFEATFPVELRSNDGSLIAQSYAQAQDDWMTENFVPFQSELVFTTDATEAVLILHKDNPSGLPEYDKALRVPVKIAK